VVKVWCSLVQISVVVVWFNTAGTAIKAQQARPDPRVRSEIPVFADAIARGIEQSTTFRLLVEAISKTDGLVYVTEGKCGQGVRACLHMSVESAGPYRLLRVVVTSRRAPGCELTAAIGHELQHAFEALSDPRIRTGFGLSAYFHRIGPEGPRRFETPEAIEAGVTVMREVCNGLTNR
jgi:hypothetical protein